VLPVDETARVRPAELRAAIEADPGSVALVSVMWANNEVGTVQPIAELAATAREHGVPVHSDAVQAIAGIEVDFAASGLDAMSVTGHKLGGPVGTGALLLRRDVNCVALLHGGGQERDVRSGTLDVAGIVGLATATGLTVARRAQTVQRLAQLRAELVDGVLAAVADVRVNGHPELRLPGLANLTFAGCEGDALLMLLDSHGVECSTGSACSAGVAQPSHVLTAMGADPTAARGSLRFSLGHDSTSDDVAAALAAIVPSVERARRAGRVGTASMAS